MATKKYLKDTYSYRKHSRKKLSSLATTVRRSFSLRMQPEDTTTESDIIEALGELGQSPKSICCIYCGKDAEIWDHFHALVVNKEAKIYESNVKNSVPSCGRCNESRQNRPWQEWIIRMKEQEKWWGIKDGEEERHRLLRIYESSHAPIELEPENIYGAINLKRYEDIREKIIQLLKEADTILG